MNTFELHRLAIINEVEKTVLLQLINRTSLEHLVNDLVKRIKKHFPPKKEDPNLDMVVENNLIIVPAEDRQYFPVQRTG